MRALVVNPSPQGLPDEAVDLIHKIGWDVTPVVSYTDAIGAAREASFDAVIVPEPERGEPGSAARKTEFDKLIRLIEERRMAAVVMGDRLSQATTNGPSLVDTVDRTISLAELRGRLAIIERYHPIVSRMERELHHMQRLAGRLDRHFREVDQEMKLAGRLQRDFLPALEAPVENIQFARVFRPALWVSGDMFDVFRLQEGLTGFYIADAVGHGMAASLLSMFIKRAIVSTQVAPHLPSAERILTPSETMAALNDALADQSLPNCQFVTACYGLFHHRTLTLQVARGGHPYPIVIAADGTIRDLQSPGGLLGIHRGAEFPTFETQLHPGDKLIMYTDGLDLAFPGKPLCANGDKHGLGVFESIATMPIQDMMEHIDSQLDRVAGSLDPRDDVTILGFEILHG